MGKLHYKPLLWWNPVCPVCGKKSGLGQIGKVSVSLHFHCANCDYDVDITPEAGKGVHTKQTDTAWRNTLDLGGSA